MNLEGKNIVVFDLEIKQVIDGVNVTWNDHDKMGISVGGLFDYRSMDYMVYLDDNMTDLAKRLSNADLVVGFHILGFDIPLLKATLPSCEGLSELKVYDLLYWVRRSIGWNGRGRFPSGMKLDDCLEGTFGKEHMKTGHGENAPKLWQEGKLGELVSYCLADVKRERMLFEHVWNGGAVTTKLNGTRKLKCPREMLAVFCSEAATRDSTGPVTVTIGEASVDGTWGRK